MSIQPITPLPQLRPVGLQGKAYVMELKRILKKVGPQLKADAIALKGTGNLTVRHACVLALKYQLNLKATCDYLEDQHIIRFGTYESLKDRGLRPMAMLTQVWNDLQTPPAEELEPWQQQLAAIKVEIPTNV